ncbi:MAG: hypothetical protein QM645_09655 [Asticcacaulis sp.]
MAKTGISKFLKTSALALVFVCAPVSQTLAFDQFASQEAMNQAHAAMRQNMIVVPAEEGAHAGNRAEENRSANRSVAPAYRPDPSVRRATETRLIADMRKHNAEAGAAAAQVFAQHDIIALYDKAAKARGLPSGDVPNAVAAYLIVMWGAANQSKAQVTRAQAQAVRKQVADGFDLSGAGLTNDAKKQTFSEGLIYQLVLVDMAMEDALNNGRSDEARRLSDMAHKQMLTAGLDMRALKLTDKGLIPR